MTPCHGLTELFYSTSRPAQALAKEICETCPLKTPCRAKAMANPDESGVWGGLTDRERSRLRRHGPKRCPVCHGEFVAMVNSAKFCSDDCRREGHSEWKRNKRKEAA